jgi:hypothetical protein
MMDEVALLLPLDLLEKMRNCFFWQNWFYQASLELLSNL